MEHTEKVEKIQKEMKEAGEKFSLHGKNLSNTLRNGVYKRNSRKLDLSSFNEVLFIDEENLQAVVEPRVTVYDLCQKTLQRGLIPLVVPEFTSITVGGAIMGAALESTSHKFGQFNESCLEYEILTGQGEKIICTPTQNEDLFYAISGSYGTLGLLTCAKLRLRKAKPYAHLKYHKLKSAHEVSDFFKQSQADFLEAIAYNENHFVAIAGNLADDTPSLPKYSQARKSSPWFVEHVSSVSHHHEELMPLNEYLFRLDRGGFWIGGYLNRWDHLIRSLLHIDVERIANAVKKNSFSFSPSPLHRFLFGWAYSSQNLYKIWHKTPKEILENLFFIHDFYTPSTQFVEAFSHFQKKTKIFPVWLCPIRGTREPQFLSPHFGDDFFINMGFYGIPEGSPKLLSHELEKAIVLFGGRKMLYSYTYYTSEEFAQIYDHPRYEKLRNKYNAHPFPSLYEKVCS